VAGNIVRAGDIICVDPVEGVVRIPIEHVQYVLDWLEKRGSSEEQIQAMVKAGGSVQEAFKKYRS
jgi:regulator of RNase E activity RraA